ncbi:LysR family transcriptional regulator [Vibrio hannami]|uniref:LysR family transcriptional regulator n=1 Tax=Vibrio hannami TaxID=2717094 RepID=UPI00240F838B|nr:LysR family transcriptional regulator [Vibrio hannami]MDG3085552.1 LysR family transcriptional regulator [Vibrio hannami]
MKSFPSQLPVFIQVAKFGSFAKTARELGISAPAVSKAIAKLEQEWQTKLFFRSSHSLSLTPVGEKLYKKLTPSVESIQGQIEQLTDDSQKVSGRIKVNLPASSIGQDIVLPHIVNFMSLYPEVDCDLSFDDRTVGLIENGFDLGIGASINEDSRLVGRPLFSTSVGLYASSGYLARHGEPQTIAELSQHICLPVRSLTTGRTHKWRLNDKGNTLMYEPEGSLTVNNFGAAKEATLLGAGISCLGDWMFKQELREKRVIPVLEQCCGERIPIWLYYSSREYLPARVKLLISYLIEHINDQTI